jgi:hypothetical protein
MEQNGMTGKRRDAEEEAIERALDILDSAGSDESGVETDTAFRTLVGLLPSASPSHGFSERVLSAVRSAPLPGGRRRLRSRQPGRVAAVIGTAASVGLLALLWAMPFVQVFIARIFLAVVQSGVWAIGWVRFIPEALRWIDLTTRPLTEVMSSTQMLSLFVAGMLMSLVALAALHRVVSASRPDWVPARNVWKQRNP